MVVDMDPSAEGLDGEEASREFGHLFPPIMRIRPFASSIVILMPRSTATVRL